MRLTRSQTAYKKLSCSSIVWRTVQAIMEKNVSQASPGELLLYETEDGRTRVECRFLEDSRWLSQVLIVELYGSDKLQGQGCTEGKRTRCFIRCR